MPLSPGARLGPYEILSALGAGGMGEVYEARDTRLDRTVAVKVLSSSLAGEPQLRERFEREARTISQLNHPHICTLHDVCRLRVSDASASQGDEVEFLVMEFIEGDTLAARLERGALKIDDALKVAVEIASALDAAHRLGVVHRDLKPLNVMLTRSGSKLLDFGLAKIAAVASAGHGTMLPTTPPNVTAPGTVLGTFQYMAPEQLEGNEADARSDIFAFGCVLYEMVTGRKAFEAKSQATLISAILRDDPPPMATLQSMTPGALDRVVRTCLAKDADERWQTAADLKRELTWIADERRGVAEGARGSASQVAASSVATQMPARSRAVRDRAVWAIAGALAGGLVAGGIAWRVTPAQHLATPVIRAAIAVSSGTQLLGANVYDRALGGRPSRTAIALSPDGRALVYTAANGAEPPQLFFHSLDRPEAIALRETRGADSPFFSPDGRWIGFWADGALRKIPSAGGPVVAIVDTPAIYGADWGTDDTVVFARASGGLWHVPASGGKAQVLTTPDQGAAEVSHRLPHFLPGGDTVVFTVTKGGAWNDATIAAYTRSTGARKTLVENGSDARFVDTGHLVFARMGTLLAVPFDSTRLEVRGGPVGVLDNVMHAINATNNSIETGAVQVATSTTGLLAYVTGGVNPDTERSLVWVDRTGRTESIAAAPGSYVFPRLSPDGRRIAVGSQRTLRSEDRDIWVHDFAGRTTTRLTNGGSNNSPAWTPDSTRVAFSSTSGGVSRLFWKAAEAGGQPEPLTTEAATYVTNWTPDGRSFLFLRSDPKTRYDIWSFSVADKKSTAVIQTPAQERWPDLSPDGRWLAYVSDETGRDEVYVQPFPGSGSKRRISASGGVAPLWSRSGREIFYLLYPDDLDPTKPEVALAAEVKTSPSFASSEGRVLFDFNNYAGGVPIRPWDVAQDGRFLLIANKRQTMRVTHIQLVVNWVDELKARLTTQR